MAEKVLGRLDIRIRDQRDKDDLALVKTTMRRRDSSEAVLDLVRAKASEIRLDSAGAKKGR